MNLSQKSDSGLSVEYWPCFRPILRSRNQKETKTYIKIEQKALPG